MREAKKHIEAALDRSPRHLYALYDHAQVCLSLANQSKDELVRVRLDVDPNI